MQISREDDNLGGRTTRARVRIIGLRPLELVDRDS